MTGAIVAAQAPVQRAVVAWCLQGGAGPECALDGPPAPALKPTLPDLPLDALEEIGQHLSLPSRCGHAAAASWRPPAREGGQAGWRALPTQRTSRPPPPTAAPRRPAHRRRVALASCCRALWTCPDVLGSPALWGALTFHHHHASPAPRLQSLAAWLARRRAALRRVRLAFKQNLYVRCPVDPVPLLAAMAGGGLADLHVPAVQSEVAAPVWDTLAQLTSLTRLDLSRGCLRGQLPAQLSSLTRLAALDLSENAIGRATLDVLPAAAPGLAHLSLRECGLVAVPRQLRGLTALRDLELGQNAGLGSLGEEAAFEPLRHLGASLTRLELAECGLFRLPAAVTALGALRALCAHSNAFPGGDACAPQLLRGLPALQPGRLEGSGQLRQAGADSVLEELRARGVSLDL